MKHSILATAALVSAMALNAQTFNVANGTVSYSFPAANLGEMVFGADGTTVNVGGRDFVVADFADMWVDDSVVEDNVVTIVYDGASASVSIAGNIAQYVDATVAGAHVSIIQSDLVGESTCGEIVYRLKGASEDASFAMTGSYKSSLELHGLTLTNPTGPAFDIQNGKRIEISVKSGTENKLVDGNGSQKGCIVCKGHLEFKGKGQLTVTGNKSHAIYAKEYVEMKNCTLTIDGSVKDGINCCQYFAIESGNLTLTNIGDDGIQADYKDETDRDAEDTGEVRISGGTIKVNVTADAAKGIKCEGNMTISGGDIDITVTGNGVWDEDKVKTKASACLGSDADVNITDGTLVLTATGGGGKGINCDAMLNISGGDISIKTSGGVVAYVNNTLYTNYTGNTDNLDSDYKSSPKGIKVDGDVNISGGKISVLTTGKGAEGIESKAVLTISDGEVNVVATDDAINSASHMYIKGGTVTVVSSGNDGLDSNGNLYIEGGYIIACGTSSPECGLDANEEEGYTVVISGGTVLAIGGGNSVPSASSGSTQPYVSGNVSVTAGTAVSLSDGTNELASFVVPEAYVGGGGMGGFYGPGGPGGGNRPGGGGPGGGGGSMLITCPGLTSGTSYTITAGTTTTTGTAALTGSGGNRPGRP